MEADVRAAEAGIAVAHKERVPDFSAGLMADVKASPAALLAAGEHDACRSGATKSRRKSRRPRRTARGEARLSAAQIELAVDFAENV